MVKANGFQSVPRLMVLSIALLILQITKFVIVKLERIKQRNVSLFKTKTLPPKARQLLDSCLAFFMFEALIQVGFCSHRNIRETLRTGLRNV